MDMTLSELGRWWWLHGRVSEQDGWGWAHEVPYTEEYFGFSLEPTFVGDWGARLPIIAKCSID